MKYEIAFNLNDIEKIILESDYPTDDLYFCDEIIIRLVQNNKTYILSNDCIQEIIGSFEHFLKTALKDKLQLHESINQDIGFLWNEELQGKPGGIYKKIDRVDHWVGEDNLLWATPGLARPKLVTWLYNDAEGSIILEVTPNYPWHFSSPKEKESFISYEEFMKDYKPLFISKIPATTAKKWLKQAQDVMKKVKENTQKYYAEKDQK